MSLHRTLVPVGLVEFEDDVIRIGLDAGVILNDGDLSVVSRSVYGVDFQIDNIDGEGVDHLRLGCDAEALARLIDILTAARFQMLDLDHSQPRRVSDEVSA